MAVTNVNFKMEEETKKQMEKVCSEIGLSLSAAFNIFAKTVVRQQGIPFKLTAYPAIPNDETMKTIEMAEKGEDLFGPFDSVDELMEELNA